MIDGGGKNADAMFESKILTTKKSAVRKEQSRLLNSYAKSRERTKRSLEKDQSSSPSSLYFEDSVDLKRIKNFAPEDTYEIWAQEPHLNKNFRRFKDGKKSNGEISDNNQKAKDQLEVEEEASESSDEDEAQDSTGNDKITRARAQYIIQKKGLEILPHIDSDHGLDHTSTSFPLYNNVSYTKKHTMVVSKLLHLNILRKNWQIAYRCFSLLIRLHSVDIRAIWPLGIEILSRLAEEEFLRTQPEGSANEYKLRTTLLYSSESSASSELALFKDEQFISWLQTFYPINWGLNPNTNYVQLPYRVGSRDTPPVYTVNLMWTLIMKQSFKKVNEKLSELLLQAPYIDDGVYYFLQGFSYQLEAAQLSKQLPHVDNQQIEKLLADAKKFYREASERDAVFPEDLVSNELSLIEKRIAENVKLENQLNGTDEMEVEDEVNVSKDEKDKEEHESDDSLISDTFKMARNPDSEEDEDDQGLNLKSVNNTYIGFNDGELVDESDD